MSRGDKMRRLGEVAAMPTYVSRRVRGLILAAAGSMISALNGQATFAEAFWVIVFPWTMQGAGYSGGSSPRLVGPPQAFDDASVEDLERVISFDGARPELKLAPASSWEKLGKPLLEGSENPLGSCRAALEQPLVSLSSPAIKAENCGNGASPPCVVLWKVPNDQSHKWWHLRRNRFGDANPVVKPVTQPTTGDVRRVVRFYPHWLVEELVGGFSAASRFRVALRAAPLEFPNLSLSHVRDRKLFFRNGQEPLECKNPRVPNCYNFLAGRVPLADRLFFTDDFDRQTRSLSYRDFAWQSQTGGIIIFCDVGVEAKRAAETARRGDLRQVGRDPDEQRKWANELQPVQIDGVTQRRVANAGEKVEQGRLY